MAFLLSPIGNNSQIDARGDPLVGGTVDTYLAGTTTKTPTYNSVSGGLQTNPIILNSLGLPPNPLWLNADLAYRFVVKDTFGNVTRVVDNIYGAGGIAVGDGGGGGELPFGPPNVINFGADNTGIADSTAAFAAAALSATAYSNVTDDGIDAPKPLNCDVLVPAGKYKLLSKVKTQRRVTWHFADGAIVDDSSMLDGIINRGSRVNSTQWGISGNACTFSFRANKLPLDADPEVYGIAAQAGISVNGPFHSVGLYTDNTGVTCATLTGTTFTATSVTFTNALDFADFKLGSSLTIGSGPGSITGMASSWIEATKTINVLAWYIFTGVSNDTTIPTNGSVVKINYFDKIWAHNANVTLPPGADTIRAAGFELGLLNNQADVPETQGPSTRYLWGYDAVNLGTFTSNTAFIARNKFVEGFLSRGPKYSFRVLPAAAPANDLTLVGFSYEQETGSAFRSVAGGVSSFQVSFNGTMELGRTDVAQSTFIDFHSSGNANDFDCRIVSVGGSATAGAGALTHSAASHNFNSPVRPTVTNATDLGAPSLQWRSLYLGTSVFVNGVKVLGLRDTGWAPMTGTANKATVYDTSTITLVQLAERVKALQDMLAAHGIIGP